MSEDFKRLVESLRTALATADAKGSITFANDAFSRLMGRERSALEGTPLAALFAEDDRKRIQQNIARVGDGKAAASLVDARGSTSRSGGCRCRCSRRSARAKKPKASWCCCATSAPSARPRKR